MKNNTSKYVGIFFLIAIFFCNISCNERNLPDVNSLQDKTPPTSSFTYKPVDTNHQIIQFSNLSKSATTYLWDFGNGDTSSLLEPSVTYAKDGRYNVTLISSDNNNVSATYSLEVVVGKIQASFTYSASTSNQFNIAFTNTSLFADSFLWEFNDGTVSKESNPTKTYPQKGIYYTTLVASNSSGIKSTFSDSVYVGVVKADFSFVTNDKKVTFTNKSAGSSTYSWNFGDGSVANTDTDPIYTYKSFGTYTVTLTATSASGVTHTTTKSIIIGLPIASFTKTINDHTVTFKNTSFNSTGYSWDFGDGNTSTDANPVHTYSVGGTHIITLTATDKANKQDTYTDSVKLIPVIFESSFEDNQDLSPYTSKHTSNTDKSGRRSWSIKSGEILGITSSPVKTGTQAAKFDVQSNNKAITRRAYQEIDVSPNTDYVVTIHYTIKSSPSGEVLRLAIIGKAIKDTTEIESNILTFTTGSDQTNQNQYVTLPLSFNSGNSKKVAIYMDSKGIAEARVDDVSISFKY